MEVNVLDSSIELADLPIIVVGLTEEEVNSQKDYPLSDLIGNLIGVGDFKGSREDLTLLYPSNIKSKRLLLVGLGKKEELDLETIRGIIGVASRTVRDLDVKEIGLHLSSFTTEKLNPGDVAEALIQSVIMGSYNEAYYKTKDLDKIKQLSAITLFDIKPDPSIKIRANTGKVIGEAVNYCRKLAWGPGNIVTPSILAKEAIRIGKAHDLIVTVYDRAKAKELGYIVFLQ